MNRESLARFITVDEEKFGSCWVYDNGQQTNSGYPYMFTYLGGQSKWLAHRVAWGLLMGGHGQRQQLDHLCGCIVGPGCVSPVHLEPVSVPENNRRKFARQKVVEGLQPHRVKECGRPFNREALGSPKVQQFAKAYGLPLPAI
ncbi:hypothetical protein [Glutamicibacter sp. AOP5-A2-18]|uniref:hypothetical protein n=1 Tax=Glutamicibacter sp. AOP5-A2-18 TaxID=3457656 RepID=UPI004034B8B6